MEPITMIVMFTGARLLVKWLDSGKGREAIESIQKIARLAWHTVSDWFAENRISAGDSGTLIKKSLASGDYRVVCGVFSSGGERLRQTSWECSGLDPELERRLGNRDRITIKL